MAEMSGYPTGRRRLRRAITGCRLSGGLPTRVVVACSCPPVGPRFAPAGRRRRASLSHSRLDGG